MQVKSIFFKECLILIGVLYGFSSCDRAFEPSLEPLENSQLENETDSTASADAEEVTESSPAENAGGFPAEQLTTTAVTVGNTPRLIPTCSVSINSAVNKNANGENYYLHDEDISLRIRPIEGRSIFTERKLVFNFINFSVSLDGSSKLIPTGVKTKVVYPGIYSANITLSSRAGETKDYIGSNMLFIKIFSEDSTGARTPYCIAIVPRFSVAPQCAIASVSPQWLDLNESLTYSIGAQQIIGENGIGTAVQSIKWSGMKYNGYRYSVDEVNAEYAPISAYPLSIGPFLDEPQVVGFYKRYYTAYSSANRVLCKSNVLDVAIYQPGTKPTCNPFARYSYNTACKQ